MAPPPPTADERPAGTPPAAVAVEAVSAGYGDGLVVDEVSLTIDDGEVVALLGPSGCGKTTLLRTIAGLTRIAAGTIRLGGEVVSGPGTHRAPEKRRVGMVFQDGALFPHLDVAGNIRFGLKGRPDAERRLQEVLALTRLDAFRDRRPAELSGGQQQRVAVARALAPRPDVLLLDEPFSALDAGLRVELRREVRQILRDVGTTAVVVTHDQDEAFAIGDRVGVMRAGRLLQIGPPKEVYRRPVEPWVAGFVGEANEFAGVADGGRLASPVGDLPVSADDGTAVRVVVRPEQLAVAPGDDWTVRAAEFQGGDARLTVAGAGRELSVRDEAADVEVGDSVGVRFRGSSVPWWPTDD